MAKYTALLAIFCIILSTSSSVLGGAEENFKIVGKVYCDPCRIEFPTRISYNLGNAKVKLVCRDRVTEKTTYQVDGVTDASGQYTITATGDHEDEVCDVKVVESPEPKCPVLMRDELSARVSLTDKNGVKGNERYANPIGFMVTEADARCKEVLDELGYVGIDDDEATQAA